VRCALGRQILTAALALPVLATAIFAAEPERDAEVKPSVITLKDRFRDVTREARKPTEVAPVGERLTYQIKWKGVPAGQAVFSVKRLTRARGEPVLYLALETETNDAVSCVYAVRDKIKSYVCARTGRSVLFQRDLNEGSYSIHDSLQFDYENEQQYYTRTRYDGSAHHREEKAPRPIPGPVQDPLSVLYYLRHFPLEIGEEREVPIGTHERTGILAVTATRRERIEIPTLGAFDAHAVRLEAAGPGLTEYDPEIFRCDGDIELWVEQETNIPLILKVKVPILGSATAILRDAENTPLLDHVLAE
jgi:hypothetical protein